MGTQAEDTSGGVRTVAQEARSERGPLGAAWLMFRANAGVCLGAFTTWVLAWVLLEFLVFATHEWGALPNLFLHLVYLVFSSALELGFLAMALDISDGGRPSYSDLFAKLEGGPSFLLAKLGFLMVLLIGLVLLVVPGVWLGVRYSMFAPHMALGERGVRRALEASERTVRGSGRRVLGFWLRVALLNALGACLLGVGLFATVPTTVLALAIFFRRLTTTQPEETDQASPSRFARSN